jgi:hypothetical protein
MTLDAAAEIVQINADLKQDSGSVRLRGQGEQQMLGADIVTSETLSVEIGFMQGMIDADARLNRQGDLNAGEIDAAGAHQRGGRAAGFEDERKHQMGGLDSRVVPVMRSPHFSGANDAAR